MRTRFCLPMAVLSALVCVSPSWADPPFPLLEPKERYAVCTTLGKVAGAIAMRRDQGFDRASQEGPLRQYVDKLGWRGEQRAAMLRLVTRALDEAYTSHPTMEPMVFVGWSQYWCFALLPQWPG